MELVPIYVFLVTLLLGLAILCFWFYQGKRKALRQSVSLRMQIETAKTSEEEFRDKNRQLRSLIMSIPDVLYFKDAVGQVLLANKSFVDAHPEAESQSEDGRLESSAPIEILEGSEEHDLKVLASGQPQRIEQVIQSPPGKGAVYDTVKTPIAKEGGEIVGMVSASRDVTELRELEMQLRQAQKMESLGLLAGGIAHDFNNILTAIFGYGTLIEDQLDPQSTSYARLERLLSSAHRASDLVTQILTFSRQNERERKPLKLEFIVRESLQLLQASIPATIEIVQEIDRETGYILGDVTEIHQILMNLCVNASHAMEKEGGKLTVRVQSIERDARVESVNTDEEGTGRCIRLSVEDTGHGMDDETVSKIFDPFFTTKEPGKGTGLGLSVVHGIVAACGGCMTVDSAPGRGTTFDLFFPEIERVGIDTDDSSHELLSGEGHILFVDDEQMLVEMTSEVLNRLGYRVTAATSSGEALETFKSSPSDFDLVITDLMMPKMTGDALAREILEIRPDTPIVLTTGFSDGDRLEKAKAIGIRKIMPKPLLPHQLAKTIHDLLHAAR